MGFWVCYRRIVSVGVDGVEIKINNSIILCWAGKVVLTHSKKLQIHINLFLTKKTNFPWLALCSSTPVNKFIFLIWYQLLFLLYWDIVIICSAISSILRIKAVYYIVTALIFAIWSWAKLVSLWFALHRIFAILYLFYNYSPRWRWLVLDIHRAAKRRGIYPSLSPTLRWIIDSVCSSQKPKKLLNYCQYTKKLSKIKLLCAILSRLLLGGE